MFSVHSNKANPEHQLVSTQLKKEGRVRGQYLDRSNNLILKNCMTFYPYFLSTTQINNECLSHTYALECAVSIQCTRETFLDISFKITGASTLGRPSSYTSRFPAEPLRFAKAGFYFCFMSFGLKGFLRFYLLVTWFPFCLKGIEVWKKYFAYTQEVNSTR